MCIRPALLGARRVVRGKALTQLLYFTLQP